MICNYCNKSFLPNRNNPKQKTCGSSECKKAHAKKYYKTYGKLDKTKNQRKTYYKANRLQILKKTRLRHIENKEHEKNIHKLRYIKYRERFLIRGYTAMDKKRGFDTDLTFEWMRANITNKPCHYCKQLGDVGCDRVDNTKGHTMDNVVPCCCDCNRTRGDRYTYKEMCELGIVIREIKERRSNCG